MTENNLRIGPAGIPTNQFRKEYEVLIDNCKNNGFSNAKRCSRNWT